MRTSAVAGDQADVKNGDGMASRITAGSARWPSPVPALPRGTPASSGNYPMNAGGIKVFILLEPNPPGSAQGPRERGVRARWMSNTRSRQILERPRDREQPQMSTVMRGASITRRPCFRFAHGRSRGSSLSYYEKQTSKPRARGCVKASLRRPTFHG